MENKMLKFVSIIGSTGEIGNKTLEIISSQKNKFKVSLLSCNQNIHILKKQVKKFKPNFVYISKIEERDKFKKYKFNFKNKQLVIQEPKKGLFNLVWFLKTCKKLRI